MPTTSLGLVTPDLTAAPNVPSDLTTLANTANTAIVNAQAAAQSYAAGQASTAQTNAQAYAAGLQAGFQGIRSSGNASDSFASGSFAALVTGAAALPAGTYMLGLTIVSECSAATSGYLRLTANGTSVFSDVEDDFVTASGARASTVQGLYAWGGGTMTLVGSRFANTGTGTVYTTGTKLWAFRVF